MQPAHDELHVEREMKAKRQDNIFFHASLRSLCGRFTYKWACVPAARAGHVRGAQHGAFLTPKTI